MVNPPQGAAVYISTERTEEVRVALVLQTPRRWDRLLPRRWRRPTTIATIIDDQARVSITPESETR